MPKDVKFIVPEITCNDKQEIWYHEPETNTDTRMTNTFKYRFEYFFFNNFNLFFCSCEVKKTSHCRSVQRPDCKQITWNECREAPVQKCSYKKVHLPTQELLHRKKCLLPDAKPEAPSNNLHRFTFNRILNIFSGSGYGGPQAPVLNTYSPTYTVRQ